MKSFLQRLQKDEVLLADGAMGSLLMARGLKPGLCPESFALTDTNTLSEIAAMYLQAGAEIIQTNTFGASPIKLANYDLQDRTEEINKNALQAVRKAVNNKVYVSGSCGPSGKLLKPYGTLEADELFASYYRQLQVLIENGIDIICIETMTDINEALVAIKAARTISTSIPIMATMTFEKTPRGFYTIMGVDIKGAVKQLQDAGANIIGSNCGNGIENMVLIAKEFKQYSHLPILIQANAGIPQLKGTQPVYPETPEFMAEKAKELIDMGIEVIGGCCGTTPDHIRALRQLIDSSNNP